MDKTIDKNKVVAIVVYPGVSALELTATYSTLNGLKMAKYEVYIVAESAQPFESDTPLKIVPHKSFEEVPDPDILVVMGGGLPSLSAIANPGVRSYIQAAALQADTILGIGAGSVALAACGLLQNRPSTTHWAFSGLLERLGARFVQERWVEDGKFITTAGGTGGMDMALKFLARLAGENNARILQLFAEYDPQPPFGGVDWSEVEIGGVAPFAARELETFAQSVATLPDLHQAVLDWTNPVAAAFEPTIR